MKPLVLLLATSIAAQYLPSCTWSDCLQSWDTSSCTQSSGWSCICNNTTAISQINTCVATSCTNATDQEQIYGAIAQICANAGTSITNSEQATFSATSGGSLMGSASWGPGRNWGSKDWEGWASRVSTAVGGAPSGWSSGRWGIGGRPGGFGPWATKASGIACSGTASWTTWTAGWGPFSSWTGTWSGCSSTTASPVPATVTTTVNGQVITGTTFGIQALAASSGSVSGSGAGGSKASMIDTGRVLTVSGLVVGSVLVLMVAL